MFLAIYRIGFYIPLPIVDQAKLPEAGRSMQSSSASGKVFGTVAMFGGTRRHEHDLRPGHHAVHLGLDHLPAPRRASYPPLEELQKEGESGRKKINEYTRYATVSSASSRACFWVAVHR